MADNSFVDWARTVFFLFVSWLVRRIKLWRLDMRGRRRCEGEERNAVCKPQGGNNSMSLTSLVAVGLQTPRGRTETAGKIQRQDGLTFLAILWCHSCSGKRAEIVSKWTNLKYNKINVKKIKAPEKNTFVSVYNLEDPCGNRVYSYKKKKKKNEREYKPKARFKYWIINTFYCTKKEKKKEIEKNGWNFFLTHLKWRSLGSDYNFLFYDLFLLYLSRKVL